LLRNCVEVREPIELSFGVVSGVGGGSGYCADHSTRSGQFHSLS